MKTISVGSLTQVVTVGIGTAGGVVMPTTIVMAVFLAGSLAGRDAGCGAARHGIAGRRVDRRTVVMVVMVSWWLRSRRRRRRT